MTLNISITRRSGLTTGWQIEGGEKAAVRAIHRHVDKLWQEGFSGESDGDLPQLATVGSPDGHFFRVYQIPIDNTRDLMDLDSIR